MDKKRYTIRWQGQGENEIGYDIRIGVKVAGTEDLYAVIAQPDLHSPAHNLEQIFRACTGWDFVQNRWYNCDNVLSLIVHGINELNLFPEEYRIFEPDNGVGSVESAREALESIFECIIHNWESNNQIPLECLYICW